MAVMMPTNYSAVQCITVLIGRGVNPNLKASVITLNSYYIILLNRQILYNLLYLPFNIF